MNSLGKGICSDQYVGNRRAQETFRRMFGGSRELPIDLRRRLDAKRKKKSRRK